jgi:hypothetical protein
MQKQLTHFPPGFELLGILLWLPLQILMPNRKFMFNNVGGMNGWQILLANMDELGEWMV